MDPLTITTSVLRITGSCVGAAHTLWEIRKAWKRAPVTVSALCSQLKITAASLSQIQSLLLSNTDVLRENPDLVDTFDTTLTSCMVLPTMLEGFVQKIKKGALEGTKETWKMKFRTIWNENEVKKISQQLNTQQDAIGLLVSLLQMDSLSEIKRLVRRHDRLLLEIASNTRHIRETHGVNVPESVLGTDEASQSIFSQLFDDTKYAEPEFEKALLGTKLYTRAFNGVLESTSDKESVSDDAQTMVIREASDCAPTNCVAELKSLVHVLDINYVYIFHPHSDEITRISNICKLPKHRYQGQDRQTGLIHEFDRTTVRVSTRLKGPIKVSRTKAGRNEGDQDRNGDEEKEMISIDAIKHDFCWWTYRGRLVDICNVELEESVERDVDQVLEYFSCPIPGLAQLPQEQQRQKMLQMLSDNCKDHMIAVLAHCRTFKDLQCVASFMRG